MGPGGPSNFVKAERIREKLKEPKPKNIKEVPGYVYRVVTKFFSRLFYIFRIVWETKPWILIHMVFMAVFNGVNPVINAFIDAALLNGLGNAFMAAVHDEPSQFDSVMVILIIRFAYTFLVNIINRISGILNNIEGGLVVNHINMKIMRKSREVDLASFDLPEFYEKFENAKREAGRRPIQILNNNFTITKNFFF